MKRFRAILMVMVLTLLFTMQTVASVGGTKIVKSEVGTEGLVMEQASLGKQIIQFTQATDGVAADTLEEEDDFFGTMLIIDLVAVVAVVALVGIPLWKKRKDK